MKARLGSYAGWQLRDFLFERAAALVVIGALLVWVTYEQIGEGARQRVGEGGAQALEFGARVMAQHLGFIWFVCALIAVHGISANDRTSGRFRLIFAKPVHVLPYYAQAFFLHGAGFLLCTMAGVAALSRLVPVTTPTLTGAVAVLGVSYLLVGGVCFLFSAIWRLDWLSTVVLTFAVVYLAGKFPRAAWLGILPPFWMITDQIAQIKAMVPVEAKPLLWASAYGVACFLLGLIVLKRRPLAN